MWRFVAVCVEMGGLSPYDYRRGYAAAADFFNKHSMKPGLFFVLPSTDAELSGTCSGNILLNVFVFSAQELPAKVALDPRTQKEKDAHAEHLRLILEPY